jgi:hypothetical protein
MLYFPKIFLFLIVLLIEICIDARHPAQAGWIQKIQEADLEQLKPLKEQCSNMLSRKDNSVKTQRRWANRLKLVEQHERGLKREAKKISNTHLTKQNLAKKQREEAISIEGWPKNLELLSSNHLTFLQAHCLKMTEYEDLLPEGKVWSSRLNQLEMFQKSLQKQRIEQSKKMDSELQEKSAEISPYTVHFIYVDPKNPRVLDLHGVASAPVAEKKVDEFIRAAKSKRKESVKVITGKGNHVGRGGKRGVLFKAFPRWMADDASIKNYKVSKEGGGYVITLRPSPKVWRDEPILLEHHTVHKEIKKKVENLKIGDIYHKKTRLHHEAKLARKNQWVGYYDYTAQFISYAYEQKRHGCLKKLDNDPWEFDDYKE